MKKVSYEEIEKKFIEEYVKEFGNDEEYPIDYMRRSKNGLLNEEKSCWQKAHYDFWVEIKKENKPPFLFKWVEIRQYNAYDELINEEYYI